jgi:bifunctional UDP-N-acetylglucosamine pyrophosphorylase/glucosamine-1-phosphate N-acetyltransferase
MGDIKAVILAAGSGTRMKSRRAKVLHRVCGRPIIDYVLDAASEICTGSPIVIAGGQLDEVPKYLGSRCKIALQQDPTGTGCALLEARQWLNEYGGYVLVLPGDLPLITGQTLYRMIQYTLAGEYEAVVLSTPGGEYNTASGEERFPVYCFKTSVLLKYLNRIKRVPINGEYSADHLLEEMKNENVHTGVFTLLDSEEVLDVNNRQQLAQAERLMRRRINNWHMQNGVTLLDPEQSYIDFGVKIGHEVTIYPGNVLQGNTVIKNDCVLYPNNRIVSSKIGKGSIIQNSVILESSIGEDTTVGPFAYIRPGSDIGDYVRIGDFVEIKNSRIGYGTKVSHLTYVGDGDVGNDVNVGCGVVFVNYDGHKKHRTFVGDGAFIGCNVNLVAPVDVGDHAYIAAGSTITENVPPKALSIARERQINKEGWVEKRKTKEER